MTKVSKVAALLSLAIAMPTIASAHDSSHYAHGHHHHHHDNDGKVVVSAPATKQVVIRVSCFRGPTDDIIWDKPNAVFIDSLVEAGYTFDRAHSIAYRVCRDADTVNDNEALKATMERIYRDPASRRDSN